MSMVVTTPNATGASPAPDRAALLPAFLAGAGVLGALFALPLVHLAANRLVVGAPHGGIGMLGMSIWPIAGLVCAGCGLLGTARERGAALAALIALCAALLLLAIGLGDGAGSLIAGRPGATRVRLASGAFVGAGAIGAAIILAVRRLRTRWIGFGTGAALLAAFAALAASGRFDGLSLMVEYRARSAAVQAALLDHLGLSTAALALALASTILLYASRRTRALVELAIGGVQVVPAVALLGGLVALVSLCLDAVPGLRALGIAALGPVPAVTGIAAYLMLPLWRGLRGGLAAADPATLDAATALGLTPRRILLDIRLPLGAPILIGAVRVAAVQAIGLATLGALVGAGGLGAIVFDGMAQFAPDLILLGAIPIVALSLTADGALSVAERWASRRRG